METRNNIIFFALLALCTRLMAYQVSLADGLCNLAELSSSKTCTQRAIAFQTSYPVFYILVHGATSSGTKLIGNIQWTDAQEEFVPNNFFQEQQYNNQAPIRCAFNWSGSLSDKARHEAGLQLAQIVDGLHDECAQQGITPKIIILGHSHGGNVIAVASNLVKKPIDVAIFVGTPILRFAANEVQKEANRLYLPSKIKQLFSFYSMQDFTQAVGGALVSLKRRYAPIEGIDLYNVRLFIQGQEPLHTDAYNEFFERHVLRAIQRIKEYFIKNKNVVINIDPFKSEANYLIAIRTYNTEKTSRFTGTPVDSLWPDWTQFTFEPGQPDEAALSMSNKKVFEETYQKEFTGTANLLDRTTRTLQEAQCDLVVGPVGARLKDLPEAVRTAAGAYCCGFGSFSRVHPQASRALACDVTKSPQALTQQDTDLVCNALFGNAGRLLKALPQAARQDLNKRCCNSPSFTKTHLQAAKAISCPAA